MTAEQLVFPPCFVSVLIAPGSAWRLCRPPPLRERTGPNGRQLAFRQVIKMGRDHPKPKSLGIGPLTGKARPLGELIPFPRRPRQRLDCEAGPRPCPWVSCRYHLFLDVSRGAARLNFPDLEPDQMAQTCALDVAEQGGLDLIDVGEMLNVTMERARQIEEGALLKIKRFADGVPGRDVMVALRTLRERADTA